MKKFACLSLILCLALLMQCTILPAAATSAADGTDASQESTVQDTEVSEETVSINSTAPFGTVCIQNGCRTIEGMSPLAGSDRLMETAQAAFVYEINTGTVIYSYNPDTKLAPGSLAKIVTALIAIEMCELDEVVTCSDGIQSKVPSGGQSVKLKSGEELMVEELLHCLLLVSANDAAVALAEHISGNLQGFVTLMNDRVKQMGCTNTEFVNVHGLDADGQYTTARDMARILMTAMENETFRQITSTTGYSVPATNKTDTKRSLTTINYLISEATISKYYDERVTGGLASHTTASGASLACTAESKGMSLVLVALGCTRKYAENGWQVTSYGNFDEMVELLELVFGNYKVNRVLYEGQALEQFSVTGGESDVVGGVNVNYDSVLPADAQMTNLIMQYDRLSAGLSAPVSAGDKIATVEVWYRNSCLMEAELFAMGNVKATEDSATIRGSGQSQGGLSGFLKGVVTVCVVILVLAVVYLAINSWRRSMARSRRRRRRANRRRSR